MIETLATYLRFPFVQYALVAGTLTALCASLLGVPLVLRLFSYIGDGLSHVAFGAMAFAAVFGLTDRMTIVLPATVVCAILLLCGGRRQKIKGDAAIAMLSAGSLAVGYLLLNIFAPSANLSGDVCGTLFGATAILTLTKGEVIATVVLSVAVVTMFVLCYNTLFAIIFDETFAKAS
ncbi:MAG: metal ABC transporter permease, partial [Treponema sp.]|nr:metal ABC transporter permease [Treponema sp.]